ncbi:MAG: hypothetical protein AAF682_31215 [Planctomycetota bacterium]
MSLLASLLLGSALGVSGPEVLKPIGGPPLRLADGRLVRLVEGEPHELECTTTEGPGEVYDAALDPAGLIFVAAENGLFVIDGRAEALDPIQVEDGAPAGLARSLHVDAQRRLWIATDEAVGVLDPSFYWGRTLGADELPGAGPYRIEGRPWGLIVYGSEDKLRYRPDAGDAPRVVELRVDGEPFAPDAEVELRRDYRDPIRIAADAEAPGGATLRYRLDGHHVWRAMEGELVLDRVSPGRHRLDVVAIDRDLNRSRPASVALVIDYPFYYEKGFVLAVGAGLGVAATAFFLLRARRSGRGSYARAVVSTGVALVIGVQVLAGLVPHNKAWPFVGFSMYSDRYKEGDAIHKPVLVGLGPGGGRWTIPPQAVGVAIDSPWQVLRPVIDGGASSSRELMATYRKRFPKKNIVGLQVQSERIRITGRGPIPVAPLVLSHFREER